MSRRSPLVAIPPNIDSLHLPSADPDPPPPPAPTKYSHPLSPNHSSSHRSFAERKANASSRPQPLNLVEGNDIMRGIERPPPGDVTTGPRKKPPTESDRELTKQKSQYFEGAFAVKETTHPAKEKVLAQSVVMIDLKTNVVIQDEHTFITSLATFIATRYARPLSSVAVNLDHSRCTMFGGTFDPNYFASVYALPQQVQPTTNKRNAALMQKFLEEHLRVHPSRGYTRFVATAPENVARGGQTLVGELEEAAAGRMMNGAAAAAAEGGEEVGGVRRRGSKVRSRLSVRGSLQAFRFPSAPPTTPLPTTAEEEDTGRADSASESGDGGGMAVPSEEKATRRKKSFVANFFGRS
ncbi:Tautomerase/MIF superfamily [Coniochaeta sp. 2T2.1]|nr:Tautomerase/MIF superfamily [Coniochaeta sp. 2T2.1]